MKSQITRTLFTTAALLNYMQERRSSSELNLAAAAKFLINFNLLSCEEF